MNPIEVRPVCSRRERRAFLLFPWSLYRRDPLWVPPLLPERATVTDPRRGPFFRRGQAEFYVAWRDGQPVGTVCAAEDKGVNELAGKRECMLGFFECIDDQDVARALFAQVCDWARAHALSPVVGPFHLDRESSYGVLIEGRDRPPALLCGHTPPWYQGFFERFGFVPLRGDNLAYAISLQDTPALQRLERLAQRVQERKDITIRQADRTRWSHEVDHIYHLLLHALAHLPDAVPWRRDEVEALLEPFARFADPELILFAEVGGQTVGWFPGIPNLNEPIQRANGLRHLWDYPRLWWAMRRRPECLSVKSLLVLPEYWNTGVSVLLFSELARRARAKGYRWVDLSLTSEDNPYTPTLATRLGATLYKRYRVYRLDLT